MSTLTPGTAVLQRRPWQVDWKDPQWSVVDAQTQKSEQQQRQHDVPSTAAGGGGGGGTVDASFTATDAKPSLVVVNATTARVHPHDMPDRIRQRVLVQSLEHFNDDNNSNNNNTGSNSNDDWLLSVRLLAERRIDGSDDSNYNDHPSTSSTLGVVAASQIQIQVLHVRTASSGGSDSNNNDAGTHTTSVVLSKQLQWPETIDNNSNKKNSKDKKKKHKNWFVSKVWKPLLGEIDEEDQDEKEDDTKECRKDSNDDVGDAGTPRTVDAGDDEMEEDGDDDPVLARGIISATLCCNQHKSSSTAEGNGTTTATTTTATKAELSHAMDTIQMMNLGIPTLSSGGPRPKLAHETSSDLHGNDQDAPQQQSPSWDLYLACINHTGKIFVYNPWDLLMLPESNQNGSKNDRPDDGDDMARILFGHDLFASLEQTWRPLSEPLATLLPSVFSSGAGAIGGEGLGGGEEDTSQYVGGAYSQIPPTPPNHVHDRDDQSELDTSLHSLETSTSGGTMTSKRRRQRQSRRKRRRRQQQNPFFLWNPTFDPSTLKDATIENRPLAVHSVGSSYLVILGSGMHEVKDRDKRRGNNHLKRVNHDDATGSVGSTATDPRDVMLTSSQERPWWEKSSSSNQEGGGVIDISGQDDNVVSGIWNDEDKTEESKLDLNDDNKGRTMDDVQSTVSSMVHPEEHPSAHRQFRPGGFVTFVATAHWSESRTLFLPFAPTTLSFIAEWKGAEWILVMGPEKALLVRMNTVTNDIGFLNHPISIPIGPAPSTTPTNLTPTVSVSEFDSGMIFNTNKITIVSPEATTDGLECLLVKKYQILPVEVEVAGSIMPRLLCGSASKVEPPSLLELYVDHSTDDRHALVLLKSLSHCTAHGSVALMHRPSDVAKIAISGNEIKDDEAVALSSSHDSLADAWAQHGQGWSLVGNSRHIFLICWEGATLSDGAYVQEVFMLNGLPSGVRVAAEHIMSFPSGTIKNVGTGQGRDPQALSALASLPFSTPLKDVIGAENTRTSQIVNVGSDVIFDAMKSLSQMNTETETIFAPRVSTASSFRKSQLLLQHCASWRQLEDTVEDRVSLQRQVPMVALQAGTVDSPHRIFSIRALVDQNGAASPFQQVLAWLAQRGDYFDAASLALDLLNDADCLFHLWRNAEMIDEADGRSKLEGLLDGIIPVKLVSKEGSTENLASAERNRMTVAHLADMTIACMIKGGYNMARTLRRFLSKNDSYDPARACLMLAATAAYAVSGDSEAVEMAMGGSAIESFDDLLWPVHCILQIGKSRNYLETALQLLNVTIPDELRHRAREGEEGKLKEASVPDIELTKKLVALIVATDPAAMNIMFDFEDAESGRQYWQSLDHETRLALTLIEIDAAFPVLHHPEVRAWLRGELDSHLKDGETFSFALPTPWLQRLSTACLTNAGCDLSALEVTNGTSFSSLPETPGESEDDGLKQLKVEIAETREALSDVKIDFDVVIACLLLLDSRKTPWFRHGCYASTKLLLDAICYLAGRGADDFSAFDKSACMRYCFLANNVSAGANLIGGKNGFILQCCDILVKELNLSMSDAERLVVSERLDLSSFSKLDGSSFEFNDTHRKLLWLLDENVLSVRTFGEFDTLHTRGRVDPIFAARSILRTWLAITYCDLITATEYLGSWLFHRLEIDEESHDGSTHRLACAALARALVFSETLNGPEQSNTESDTNGDESKTLASSLNMNQKLVVQICHSCCGIVHSVDPTSLTA